MTRLVILVVLLVAAVAIAAWLRRRAPEPPSAPSYRAPAQVDRDDFADPARPVLVTVFASTDCNTCPGAWKVVEELASADVAVERIDVQDDPDRHRRYRIDGVPTTLVVDGDGVVRASFFGPLVADEVAAAVGGASPSS